MQLSPETAMLLIELDCPVEQKVALLKALERDWLAYQRPDGLVGRQEPKADNACVERKRAADRERQRQYRATDWRRLREAVFARDGFRCVYCGCDIEGEPHCDHVIPFSRGGGNTLDNLATACARCNIEKGDRTPDEWRSV